MQKQLFQLLSEIASKDIRGDFVFPNLNAGEILSVEIEKFVGIKSSNLADKPRVSMRHFLINARRTHSHRKPSKLLQKHVFVEAGQGNDISSDVPKHPGQ